MHDLDTLARLNSVAGRRGLRTVALDNPHVAAGVAKMRRDAWERDSEAAMERRARLNGPHKVTN